MTISAILFRILFSGLKGKDFFKKFSLVTISHAPGDNGFYRSILAYLFYRGLSIDYFC